MPSIVPGGIADGTVVGDGVDSMVRGEEGAVGVGVLGIVTAGG